MPSKNKLQEDGISLPCKRRLTTLTTSFSRIASTWPFTQVVQSSSTRTLSTPTSMSSPSTFMTQDESYPIKSWKENRDGSYKVFFHVPHFVDHQWAGRSSLLCCPCISATSTPRRKASPRSSSRLFVPLWFLKKFDLVAGDFNGTAWRCRSRDNLNNIDEACADCALPSPPGPPHRCGDPDQSRTTGQTSVDFSTPPALSVSGK